MSDKAREFQELNEKRSDLITRKIRLEENFKAAKKALSEVVEEIKAAGYDPKTLSSVLEQKEKELEEAKADYESKLSKAEALITEIEQAVGV